MSLFPLSDEEALALAATRGTPCFAYRVSEARSRFEALRAALPGRVRLAYAVKANPHPAILSAFARLGASFDAASGGELERLLAAGVPGPRILFAGPGKTAAEIEAALAAGARLQADGLEDLERAEVALAARPRIPGGLPAAGPVAASLRVSPSGGVAEAARIIGGSGPTAFGVDEEELVPFLREARRFSRIELRGLQVFAASNERDAARLCANHATALGIARRMEEALGRKLDLVDLGGGLGIPYAPGEAELDVEALGRGLGELLGRESWFSGELLLEPGRWLVGTCGAYLARVLRVKESRGESFAVLEGGANHLLRPLLTGQPFPARAAGKGGAEAPGARPYTLAGPLCTSLDRLGRVLLPELAPGDLVLLGQAGAYGFTEAMGAFLSHPAPEEIVL